MISQPKITAVYFNTQDVGKNIKQSKKRITWVFEIDGKMYNFVLDASMISGKNKLTCNNKIVAMNESQSLGTFQHSMTLDNCQITVMAMAATQQFELRINNEPFSHMLNQEKNKQEFVRNDKVCTDFVLDQKLTSTNISSNGQKKTIKLKIGSMRTNPLKSSIKSVQSEDWNKMVNAEENSFPNYFDANNSGVTPQNEVDLTKVSMKKKPQTQQPQQNVDLLETQTHVIEITPEQFCTMQQLFQTQMMAPQNNSAQNISQNESVFKGMNMNDFNTMQMMFQSQSGNNSTITQTHTSQPVQININVQDFSTMQMMFNTMNLGSQSQVIKQDLSSKNAQSLLNQLSDSLSCKSSQNKVPQVNNLQNINLNDFSTMQMMFATNNMNHLVFKQDVKPLNAKNQTSQNPTQNPMPLIDFSYQPNSMDFGTMASLFKTNNVSLSEAPRNEFVCLQAAKNTDPLSQMGLSSASNSMNMNTINMSDFSTMQMMFKTTAGTNSLPKAQLFGTSTPKQTLVTTTELKENQSPFGNFL